MAVDASETPRFNERSSPRTSFLRDFLDKIGISKGDLEGRSANQFLIALGATFQSLKANRGDVISDQEIWLDIETILARYPEGFIGDDENRAWDDAYRVERLMVNLYDGDRLDIEIGRRLLDARGMNLSFVDYYDGKLKTAATATETLTVEQQAANRTLLARLIEDLQWNYNRLYLKRGYAHVAHKRACIAFFVAFLAFAATLYNAVEFGAVSGASPSDPAAAGTASPAAAGGALPAAPPATALGGAPAGAPAPAAQTAPAGGSGS